MAKRMLCFLGALGPQMLELRLLSGSEEPQPQGPRGYGLEESFPMLSAGTLQVGSPRWGLLWRWVLCLLGWLSLLRKDSGGIQQVWRSQHSYLLTLPHVYRVKCTRPGETAVSVGSIFPEVVTWSQRLHVGGDIWPWSWRVDRICTVDVSKALQAEKRVWAATLGPPLYPAVLHTVTRMGQ